MRHCAAAGWDVFGLAQAQCRCGMAADWQTTARHCARNPAANCTERCPGPGGTAALCGSQGNVRMFELDCPDRHPAPPIVAFATINSSAVAVFLSYWRDPGEHGSIGPQKIELTVKLGGSSVRTATLYRIDPGHASAANAWDRMGQPDVPDVAQLEQLRAAATPVAEALSVRVDTGAHTASITVDSMPINAAYVVSLALQ